MKIDIIEIIKQSINIQILFDDKQILPIHIRKAIEYIYPNISSNLISKCRSFLSMYKQNNRILDEYNLSSEYGINDVIYIIRSFNFGKGKRDSVYYMYGLLMEKKS
jgi:hypothetical protein